jgi:hypothetical protein
MNEKAMKQPSGIRGIAGDAGSFQSDFVSAEDGEAQPGGANPSELNMNQRQTIIQLDKKYSSIKEGELKSSAFIDLNKK